MIQMNNKDTIEYLSRSIKLGKQKIEELLDAIESERKNIKFYQEELDKLNMMLLEKQIGEEVMRNENK